MPYKRFQIEKRFPRWNCHKYPGLESCGFDFFDQFEGGESDLNKKPDYNPLEKAVFDTRQGRFDIYNISLVLKVNRGFMISDRMKNIILEFPLPNYVIFDQIKYTYKGELRDDLSFIYFYTDFSPFVDFKNSEFWLVTPEFKYEFLSNKDLSPFIITKNLPIESLIDYKEKANYYSTEKKLKIWEKRICCPEAMKYDMFPIIRGPFAWGVYVSDRLQQRLAREKMKGVNYSRNIFYEFGCAG
ncbi:MAG: hypothetical protein IPH04_01730 [Saprospirales bacterium]|nr:hypothetical protein [Saprospirales bacterium]